MSVDGLIAGLISILLPSLCLVFVFCNADKDTSVELLMDVAAVAAAQIAIGITFVTINWYT